MNSGAREKPARLTLLKALGGPAAYTEEAAIISARAYRDGSRKDDAAG